jgi:hypothetical protein
MSIGNSYAWPVNDWPAIRHIYFDYLLATGSTPQAPEVRASSRDEKPHADRDGQKRAFDCRGWLRNVKALHED